MQLTILNIWSHNSCLSLISTTVPTVFPHQIYRIGSLDSIYAHFFVFFIQGVVHETFCSGQQRNSFLSDDSGSFSDDSINVGSEKDNDDSGNNNNNDEENLINFGVIIVMMVIVVIVIVAAAFMVNSDIEGVIFKVGVSSNR